MKYGLIGLAILCVVLAAFARIETARADRAAEQRAALEEKIRASEARADQLGDLYRRTLPQISEAARQQEFKDRDRMAKLQAQVDKLSEERDVVFSAHAVGVFDDIAAAANNAGNAGSAGAPKGGTSGVDSAFSEFELAERERLNAEAYQEAVRMFHEMRDLYLAARAAQMQTLGVQQ